MAIEPLASVLPVVVSNEVQTIIDGIIDMASMKLMGVPKSVDTMVTNGNNISSKTAQGTKKCINSVKR